MAPVRRRRKTYARRSVSTKKRVKRRLTYGPLALRRSRYKPQMNRLPGFPETFRTTLVYNEGITLDAGIGAAAYYSFNANSLYDPNFSGTGHQPLYYDNLCAIYGRWRIRKAYITVTLTECIVGTAMVDAGTVYAVNGTSGRLVLTRDRDAADNETLFNNIQEERSKNIKWRYYNAQTTGRYPKLKMMCIPHVMLKMSRDDSALWGSTSSNAAAQCFFNVGVAAVDDVGNPPAVRLNCRITYVCDFFDRTIDQPQN